MPQFKKCLAVAVLVAALPGALVAQGAGEDRGSLGLQAGILANLTDYPDGTEFNSSAAFGLTGKYWPWETVGIHTTLLFSATSAKEEPFTAVAFYEPKIFTIEAGPVYRRPMAMSGFALTPYVGASLGLKRYQWSHPNPRKSDLGMVWDILGGVELRRESMPRYGLTAEVRNLRSKYGWHNYTANELSMSELMASVGLSIHR